MIDNLIQRLREEIEHEKSMGIAGWSMKEEAADALQDLRALVATVQQEKEDLRAEIERLTEENRTYLEMLARAGLFPAHD